MKKNCNTILLILVTLLFTQCKSSTAPNQKINFDENWFFSIKADSTAAFAKTDEAVWRKLDLPHDWAIEDTVSKTNPSGIEGGFFVAGQAWYQKPFEASKDWKDKKIAIRFDGVFMNSDVWINGKHIGHNTNGYAGFSHDLTPYLKFDSLNILVIKVDNTNPPANRWYTGSGIYRHTWIEITGKVYIPYGGTYITTASLTDNKSKINVQTNITNESGVKQSVTIKQVIKDKAGNEISKSEKKLNINKTVQVSNELTVSNAHLWSTENPYLYKLETTILGKKGKLYSSSEPFGIRTIAFDKDQGFLLNNKKVILKGVCIHHDAGSFGAAVPDAVYLRQLLLLKELGCNAIRMSHNPQSPVLLDMCDSLGFLVIDEMFDKWSGRLTGYNTTENFIKQGEQDLKNFILRDRNRPSVILWTVGNETDEQFSPQGITTFNRLKAVVEKNDNSRKVSCAMHPGPEGLGPFTKLINYTDVICYNYRTHDFPEWRRSFPNTPFLASETKAYQENAVKNSLKIDYSPNTWFLLDKYPYISGQFIWAGIDYLGESMRWPRKGLTNGLLLTNGFFKPYAYFTQSVYSDKPMVHIAVVDDSLAYNTDTTKHWQKSWFGPAVVSHWNLNKQVGDSVDVLTYSNCDQVELYLNEKSVGKKMLSQFADRVIKWRIPYLPGKIKAMAYKGGKQYTHELQTAGTAYKLQIVREDAAISANQTSYYSLIVSVTDSKSILNPKSRNKISLDIEGAGKIVGVDNGDLSYHGSYKSKEVEVREGKVLIWIKALGKDKSITIHAKSNGLKSALFSFRTK